MEIFNLEVLAYTDTPDTAFCLVELLLLVTMQGRGWEEASRHLLHQP